MSGEIVQEMTRWVRTTGKAVAGSLIVEEEGRLSLIHISEVLMYLNRLSDYFYLLGRTLTEYFSVEETLWIP